MTNCNGDELVKHVNRFLDLVSKGKRSTECFNRRETKLPVVSESCSCRREDFECEVGFELAVDSNNCIKSSIPLVGFVEEDPPECCLAARAAA